MKPIKIILDKIKNIWNKFGLLQKLIFIVVFMGIIAIITLIILYSSSTDMVPIINVPIMDNDVLDRIVDRIVQEGHEVIVTSQGLIMVAGKNIARQMRVIILSEDLIPIEYDPVSIIEREKWIDSDIETLEKYFQENRYYLGIILIIIGIVIIIYTIFAIIYGEKLGKILASIILILLGILFLVSIT